MKAGPSVASLAIRSWIGDGRPRMRAAYGYADKRCGGKASLRVASPQPWKGRVCAAATPPQ